MKALIKLIERPQDRLDAESGRVGEGAGFIVRNIETGAIVHEEFVEMAQLSSTRVVRAIEATSAKLAASFDQSRFVVEDGYYNSQRTFACQSRQGLPDFALLPSWIRDPRMHDLEPATTRLLSAVASLGVSENVLALLIADLRPKQNERAFRELLEERLPRKAVRESVLKALDFAKARHEGQTQEKPSSLAPLGHVPYLNHPIAVARMALDAGLSREGIEAALLHDVVEDTGTSIGEIERVFGPRTGALVAELTQGTQEAREVYMNRMAGLKGEALLIKSFDRTHNLLRAFTLSDPNYLKRYLRETQAIYAPKVQAEPKLANMRTTFELLLSELTTFTERVDRDHARKGGAEAHP